MRDALEDGCEGVSVQGQHHERRDEEQDAPEFHARHATRPVLITYDRHLGSPVRFSTSPDFGISVHPNGVAEHSHVELVTRRSAQAPEVIR
jgi:hypothetical protein